MRFILCRATVVVLFALGCANPPQPQRQVHRIITLAPNITEIANDVGCGSKIVGTDDFSAANVPKVGGVEPDIEKIVQLHPDLVIASASNAHPSLRRALAAVHVPLLVIKTERLADVTRAMADVARPCGDPRRAIAQFDRALADNRRTRTHPPRLLFVVWPDPLYIAGRATFIDDLYQLTGAVNAAEVNGWPTYSLENFIAHPPDLLLYPNHSVTPQAVAALLGRAHAPIQAIAVDENSFTRPGPQLAQAAASLNAILDRWERSR